VLDVFIFFSFLLLRQAMAYYTRLSSGTASLLSVVGPQSGCSDVFPVAPRRCVFRSPFLVCKGGWLGRVEGGGSGSQMDGYPAARYVVRLDLLVIPVEWQRTIRAETFCKRAGRLTPLSGLLGGWVDELAM
jgi:hypothetical protein